MPARARTGERGGRREVRERSELRAKAEEIQASTGIPYNLALHVARGERTLSSVLERLMADDKIAQLVRKYELPKSLAAQVALGQIPLDAVLLRRDLDQHLATHKDRSVLVERAADGKPVALALHGQRTVKGVVKRVDMYEFQLEVEGVAEPETIHKLQAKFAWDPDEYKTVKKGIDTAKSGRTTVEPIWKPQERPPLSDRRLFSFLKAERAIAVHTLEGEVLRGTVGWLGRWEVGLVVKAGGSLTVFRHAVKHIEES
jgi:sRNA-binding regulator protein Hfq